MSLPTGRTYNFEVSLELTDALSFVPGELGTYLAEALFELDRANLLFPGLQRPEPGKRILSVSIQQTGYAHRPGAAEAARPSAIHAVGTDEQRELLSSIEDTTFRISDLMRDLSLIKSKTQATLEQLGTNTVWTKPQTKTARTLLAAIESVIDSHAMHIEPLL
ncbi:MAG: hypothetical protein KGJ73_07530 [Rhodospirillales bacterium]|nr:hypothetical protein [Rhodospirillales bacterium]